MPQYWSTRTAVAGRGATSTAINKTGLINVSIPFNIISPCRQGREGKGREGKGREGKGRDHAAPSALPVSLLSPFRIPHRHRTVKRKSRINTDFILFPGARHSLARPVTPPMRLAPDRCASRPADAPRDVTRGTPSRHVRRRGKEKNTGFASDPPHARYSTLIRNSVNRSKDGQQVDPDQPQIASQARGRGPRLRGNVSRLRRQCVTVARSCERVASQREKVPLPGHGQPRLPERGRRRSGLGWEASPGRA